MEEVGYELPYAQGLQLIWDYRACNGDPVEAVYKSGGQSKKQKFKDLMG